MTRDSRSEYAHRMHRVIEYIDRHLDEPLELRILAEVAHFSPFHFHRLFSAWMGETFADYVRRRRVEIGAMRLASQPRLTVMQAALSVGFGSAEAFTRAFGARFGCSPTSWRKQQAERLAVNRNPDQAQRKADQAGAGSISDHERSPHHLSERIMEVKVLQRAPVTIACLRHVGPYGPALSRFWQEVYYPWAVSNNLLDRARYGISHDDPGVTAPGQCRYDACAEVSSELLAPGEAFTTSIPGGRYAVLGFTGTVDQVGEAWTALLREWLPQSGLQLDARPCFEYYPRDTHYDANTGAFECGLCIPVIPL